MSIAENIKQLRISHGLSQKELASIAGVSDKAVSTWESSGKVPRMGAIQKIADYFHIKKSDIIEDTPSALPSTTPTSMPDAVKKLEEIKSYFSSSAALGEGVSEEDKALLLAAIEPTILQAKAAARKKFTPKKYRK